MTTPNPTRFNLAGVIIGTGVGAALCASNGPAVGISIGVALAVGFGVVAKRTC